jgi:hypothetical protein
MGIAFLLVGALAWYELPKWSAPATVVHAL